MFVGEKVLELDWDGGGEGMKVKVEFLSSLFCLITLSTTESYMREQQLSITTAVAFEIVDIVLKLYIIFFLLKH